MGSMKGKTTGVDLLDETLKPRGSVSLDMTKLVRITTDGAPAMTGQTNGLVSLLSRHLGTGNRELVKFHCIIHQQNLCGKDLGFQDVMTLATKTINFIKSRGLNHRQFRSLLEDTDTDHGNLLYYCEMRWLSRGKMLRRFWELIDDIAEFMTGKKKAEVASLTDKAWQADLTLLNT